MRAATNQRGTALITVVVIVMVTTAFGALLVSLPKSAYDGERTTEDKETAYYAANAAVADAVIRIDDAQGMPGAAVNGVWTLTQANASWTKTAPRPFGNPRPLGTAQNYSGYWYQIVSQNASNVIEIDAWGYAPTPVGFNPNNPNSAKRVEVRLQAIVKIPVNSNSQFADMGAMNFVGQDWSSGNTPHHSVVINGTGSTYRAVSGNSTESLPAGFSQSSDTGFNPGITFGGNFGDQNHNDVIVQNSSAAATSVTGVNGNSNNLYYTSQNSLNWNGNSSIPSNVTAEGNSGLQVNASTNTTTDQIFAQLEQLGLASNSEQVVIANPGASVVLNSASPVGATTPLTPKIVHVVLSGSSAPSPVVDLQGAGNFYGIVYVDARNYTGPIPANGFLKNNTSNNFYGLLMIDGPTATTNWYSSNTFGLVSDTNTGNITGTVGFKSNGLEVSPTSGSGNFNYTYNGQGSANAMPIATLTGGNGKPAIQFSGVVVSDTLSRLNIPLNRIYYTIEAYRIVPSAN